MRRGNGNVKTDRSIGCKKNETVAALYQKRIDGAAAAGASLREGEARRSAGGARPRGGDR
jgi:hypothetical protein